MISARKFNSLRSLRFGTQNSLLQKDPVTCSCSHLEWEAKWILGLVRIQGFKNYIQGTLPEQQEAQGGMTSFSYPVLGCHLLWGAVVGHGVFQQGPKHKAEADPQVHINGLYEAVGVGERCAGPDHQCGHGQHCSHTWGNKDTAPLSASFSVVSWWNFPFLFPMGRQGRGKSGSQVHSESPQACEDKANFWRGDQGGFLGPPPQWTEGEE